MQTNYGNPSSQHTTGRKAREELENAREKIAKFIGAKPLEIIFTSGGTEANDLALKGLTKAHPQKKHIITSVIEHPSILEPCKELEKEGYKIDYIKVNKEGLIDLEDIKKKISNNTLVVSIMHVNNEIGAIQPIREIGKICKAKNIPFHTDAVQSFKKLDIDVSKDNIDLMSVSGHKIHAPKGIGFLYVKDKIKIESLIIGGGQENKLRSGTENLPGIVGLATAVNLKTNEIKIKKSRDLLISELQKIPGTKINGSLDQRIYNNINVSFYGIEGESLMLMLNKAGIQVSTGSACASTKLEESHVLSEIGVDEIYLHGSIRLTIEELTKQEIKFIVTKIKEKVEKLREISPFKLNPEEKK
jgi:cysteine desulfurase